LARAVGCLVHRRILVKVASRRALDLDAAPGFGVGEVRHPVGAHALGVPEQRGPVPGRLPRVGDGQQRLAGPVGGLVLRRVRVNPGSRARVEREGAVAVGVGKARYPVRPHAPRVGERAAMAGTARRRAAAARPGARYAGAGLAAAGGCERGDGHQPDGQRCRQGTRAPAVVSPSLIPVAQVAGLVFHVASPVTGWFVPASLGCTATTVSGRYRRAGVAALAHGGRICTPDQPRPAVVTGGETVPKPLGGASWEEGWFSPAPAGKPRSRWGWPGRTGVTVRVLVIEDDEEMARAVASGLRRARMAVDVAFDGTAGLERALLNDYDVVVLDRDLPGLHGDEVCAELVAAGCRSRVLMLTAA